MAWLNGREAHVITLKEARQNIVSVAADAQPFDRQPHIFSSITGKHVAKIAGRDRKVHCAIGSTQL